MMIVIMVIISFSFFFFFAADIISCVEFNSDGELLATGDKGGRVVIFQHDKSVSTGPILFPIILFCVSFFFPFFLHFYLIIHVAAS